MRYIIKLPVMFVIMFMTFMFVLDLTVLRYEVAIPNYSILSLVIFVSGVLIIAIGGYSFRKAKTTVNPMTPEKTTQLVITGIYNYSRNPMYIGFLAWLIACVIFLGNVVNLLLLPLYIMLVNKLYIFPEEATLDKLFGSEFREYKQNVRRWL